MKNYILNTKMVQIYDGEEYEFKEYDEFKTFSYELSVFQKHAIRGIMEGHHVLVCAATGSGKSCPAEFAIDYFTKMGKRVIYTSPIKALSNQKYYDFGLKYPNITRGILTGDIKSYPDADLVVMTAEILHNQLLNKNPTENLGCVIFDEIHYINDADRGYVWEEIIMMLDPNIQLVMLSATIASPERFATWIEKRGGSEVMLSISKKRVVPLIHYAFITCGKIKKKKDENSKDEQKRNDAEKLLNSFHIIKHPDVHKNGMDNEVLDKCNATLKYLRDRNIHVTRPFVLNTVLKKMNEENMLPGIVFVFSRKQVVTLAHEVNINLQNPTVNIDKECGDILKILPNYEEYFNLEEYIEIKELLKKGIGIHHGGMLSVFREMIEIMFSKGFIKVLFATETFSVGINLPVKSAVFTQLTKFTDGKIRNLYSHEYTQMAGRAGRRGIDDVGHVIHLMNLYNVGIDIYKSEIRGVLSDKPQALSSKFKVSYNWVLNNYQNVNMVNKTMFQIDITNRIKSINKEISNLENEINTTDYNDEAVVKYQYLISSRENATQKLKRSIDYRLRALIKENSNLEKIIKTFNKINDLLIKENNTQNELNNQINIIKDILIDKGFVDGDKLTPRGLIASKIKKLNPLLFGELISDGFFDNMDPIEIIGVISCFTYYKSKNEKPELDICGLPHIRELNKYYYWYELKNKLNTGTDYIIEYGIIQDIIDWCYSQSEDECKAVLKKTSLSTGDFIKIILEISTTIDELDAMAEQFGLVKLCDKLQHIPELLLKYIATPQSLYI